MAAPNQHLQHERKLRGWSQAYTAEQIGAPDYYLSRWERGEVLPSPFYQQKLCELFGKTAEELGFLQPVNEPPSSAWKITPHLSSNTIIQNDMVGNPFSYGNPISDPRRFFGRKREIQQVFSRLRNAEFESSSLVGERRIGKSSLLKYLAHPTIGQSHGLDPNTYLFVYMDLQMVHEQITPSQLWQRLLRQITNVLADPHIKQELVEIQQSLPFNNFALEDVFDSIDAKDLYIILLLDEFEHVTKNPNFDASFFYGLRSLAIHHHLALITSSRRELIEFCHSQALRSSPFFNIFANINIELFSENEAFDLISGSLDGTAISFTDSEIETIFRIAGFHPYFLQVACSFLFDAYARNENPQERVNSLRKAFRGEAEPHLAFYWRSSDDQEKIVLITLALLGGKREANKTNPTTRRFQDLYAYFSSSLARLEKRGLVVSTGDSFILFNESFGEWILGEVTDTRHKQQSYEEWLTSHQGLVERIKGFSESDRKELSEIMSRISDDYRELLFHWLTEPKSLNTAGRTIKGFLESGWDASV